MAEPIDLGPLHLTRDATGCRFTLAAPEQIGLHVPADYDEVIAGKLREISPPGQREPALLDLENLPAISSRQLGLMLALHKALRSRDERLRVVGVHENVRRLLLTTRTAQFFDVQN